MPFTRTFLPKAHLSPKPVILTNSQLSLNYHRTTSSLAKHQEVAWPNANLIIISSQRGDIPLQSSNRLIRCSPIICRRLREGTTSVGLCQYNSLLLSCKAYPHLASNNANAPYHPRYRKHYLRRWRLPYPFLDLLEPLSLSLDAPSLEQYRGTHQPAR